MTDDKKITLDEIAQKYVDPDQFKADLFDLHVKIRNFGEIYGAMGLWALQQTMDSEEKLS